MPRVLDCSFKAALVLVKRVAFHLFSSFQGSGPLFTFLLKQSLLRSNVDKAVADVTGLVKRKASSEHYRCLSVGS